MSERVRRRARSPCDPQHAVENFGPDFVQGSPSFENSARINVHVVGKMAKRFRVGADFDDWRYDGPDDGTPSRGEEDDVGAARNQLSDLRVVIDIGETKAHLAVRHDIEQIKSTLTRHVAGFDESGDRGGAALGIRSHAFFLLGRQSAIRISRCEAPVPKRGIITRRLGHRLGQDVSEIRGCRARGHDADTDH